MTTERGETSGGYFTEEWSQETQEALVASIFRTGDISGMRADEQSAHYAQTCRSMGLNPATLPLMPLKLNGKTVLYPTRGATDQLAAMHRINREIIAGPDVRDVAGTKVGYCACRATHPNGRVEVSIATLPFSDPTMILMKLETKAKRRATLSILGLGMLDETEVQDIPARDKQAASYGGAGEPLHARQADERAAHYRGEPEPPEDDRVTAFAEDLAAMAGNLGRDLGVADVAVVWVDLCRTDGPLGTIEHADVLVECQALALRHCPRDTSKAALARAIEAERARRGSLATPAPAVAEPAPERTTRDDFARPPVTPAPVEAPYTVAQALRDLAAAACREDVTGVLALVATLKLPEGDDRAAVKTASKAALARIGKVPPPPSGGGAPRPDAPTAVDAPATPVDAEHSAAPVALGAKGTPEREAQLVASDAAWREHLAGEGTAFAISGALAKRRKAFDAAGVLTQRTRAAMERVQAVCALDSEQVAINVLRDPRRAYAGRAA